MLVDTSTSFASKVQGAETTIPRHKYACAYNIVELP